MKLKLLLLVVEEEYSMKYEVWKRNTNHATDKGPVDITEKWVLFDFIGTSV